MGDVAASNDLVQILLAEAGDRLGEQIRPIAELVGGYAESGPTYDDKGDYLCGSCKLRLEPEACVTVAGRISMETGSCYQYVKGEQAYQKPLERQFTQNQAGYSERPTDKGFGCKRCQYSEAAPVVDSKGRESFCSFWEMHVEPNACCFRNDSSDDRWAPGDGEQKELDAVADMLAEMEIEAQASEILEQVQARALFQGVKLEGFTISEEEYLRAGMSRVPSELLTNVKRIRADRGLGAKHGNYDPETNTISLSPRNFSMRQRLGKGPGWMQHAEVTIVHEIGHSVYETLTPEKQNEWNAISGWVKTDKDGDEFAPRYIEKRPGWPAYRSPYVHKSGVRFSRHYAEKSPNEDFADSFAFCLLGKGHQVAPRKRKFVEQLIQDRVRKYPQALIQSPTKAYL